MPDIVTGTLPTFVHVSVPLTSSFHVFIPFAHKELSLVVLAKLLTGLSPSMAVFLLSVCVCVCAHVCTGL